AGHPQRQAGAAVLDGEGDRRRPALRARRARLRAQGGERRQGIPPGVPREAERRLHGDVIRCHRRDPAVSGVIAMALDAGQSQKTFRWEDPLDLTSRLSDEERMVWESARAYAREQLLPRV